VALTGVNQNVGLTIQVSRPQANIRESTLDPALLALAFWWPGSMSSLFVFAQRRRLVSRNRRLQIGLLLLCTGLLAAGVSGCGASGVLTTATTTSQVTVVATGNVGSGGHYAENHPHAEHDGVASARVLYEYQQRGVPPE
jgi:hypothetical protein